MRLVAIIQSSEGVNEIETRRLVVLDVTEPRSSIHAAIQDQHRLQVIAVSSVQLKEANFG